MDAIEFPTKKFQFTPQGQFLKKHGIDAAVKLRSDLGFKENQIIPNIYYQLRKIGVHIFRRRLLNSNISGLFINHPLAGRCVLINYDEDIFRQNFTVAHEVAHSIFDINDSINISFLNDDAKNLREVRANTFAANLLVPKGYLIANKNVNWSEENIINLCIQLQVNPQVLLISLKETKIISDEYYDQMRKLKVSASNKTDSELSELSDKVQQSKEILLDLGLSTFYVRNCYEAYLRNIISASKMAEMFLIQEADLPRILQLFNLKLLHAN